jgi:outer membrane lipoprotein-sorting protein
MKIIRPGWSREIRMKAWSKGDHYTLIKILAPARDKGVAYLKVGKEIWNWQPSIERSIKLPPSMMGQSWMGSDFSNDDLVRESSEVRDYTHRIIGSDTLQGRECWKIELRPKEDAAVVWGKIIMWISKKDYLELRAEFYDEDATLINIMKASDIKNMNGRIIPTRLEMIPADKPKQKTVIVYEDIQFDIPIPDRFFSLQNMKKVR